MKEESEKAGLKLNIQKTMIRTSGPITSWQIDRKLWNILQEMRISDRLTGLLRNLYAGQEATIRTGHGTTNWFQIVKIVHPGCILSPCLFNLHAEYITEEAMAPHSSTLA